jgi:hypothetical protein
LLRRNVGTLSKRAREVEFKDLTADEPERTEAIYADALGS